MALDPSLLDRFEREWNDALEQYDDALEHYEARTTAARLGDTSVQPFQRTKLDPKIVAGIQDELFGPLQSKLGLLASVLASGTGRRSATEPATPEPRLFQTRAGVFSVDPFTGESSKIIDVPPPAQPQRQPRTYPVIVDEGVMGLTQPAKVSMTAPEFLSWEQSAPPQLRTNAANAAISRMLQTDGVAAGPSVSRTNTMLKRLRYNRSTGEFE